MSSLKSFDILNDMAGVGSPEMDEQDGKEDPNRIDKLRFSDDNDIDNKKVDKYLNPQPVAMLHVGSRVAIRLPELLTKYGRFTSTPKIPNCWYLDNTKGDNCPDHPVDPHGMHANYCNGTSFYEIYSTGEKKKVICCGKTPCFFCGTPLHGCTDNECRLKGKTYIEAHRYCLQQHNRRRKSLN